MKVFVTYGKIRGYSYTENQRNAVIDLDKSIYTAEGLDEAICHLAEKEHWPKGGTVITFFSVEPQ